MDYKRGEEKRREDNKSIGETTLGNTRENIRNRERRYKRKACRAWEDTRNGEEVTWKRRPSTIHDVYLLCLFIHLRLSSRSLQEYRHNNADCARRCKLEWYWADQAASNDYRLLLQRCVPEFVAESTARFELDQVSTQQIFRLKKALNFTDGSMTKTIDE